MSWHNPENSEIPKEMIGNPKTIMEFKDFKLKRGFDKLFNQMYFDMAGAGGWMPAVKQALLVIKPERLCFATDYPHEMGRPGDLKAYINSVRKLDIPDDDKMKIFGGNIRSLFKT